MIAKLAQLHPERFFLETWRAMDREALASRSDRYDYRPLVVLCAGAVFLTAIQYLDGTKSYVALLEALDVSIDRHARYWALSTFAWWAGWQIVGYLLLPMLTLRLMGERVRDYGLETKGFREHAWIYVLSYAVVLVCVLIASTTDQFSTYYPLYKSASRSWLDFAVWEAMYAAQFLALEFFFRGYWLRACQSMMGSHAIFAMVVPYCMIHFGKPWPEALAAIFAGIVLGTLAMKTRSIWSGVLIHVSVAITMDVTAMLQTTGLPEHGG